MNKKEGDIIEVDEQIAWEQSGASFGEYGKSNGVTRCIIKVKNHPTFEVSPTYNPDYRQSIQKEAIRKVHCRECQSQLVHHDRRNELICPFCDL